MERREMERRADEYLQEAMETETKSMKINRLVLATGFYLFAEDYEDSTDCEIMLEQNEWVGCERNVRELCCIAIEPMIQLEDMLEKQEDARMRRMVDDIFS